MPAPVKSIPWSPSVFALDTPAPNSSVEAPEIVSVPLPATVGSMVVVSPLSTSIVSRLVKVVGSIVSEPFVASASIVPLLVKAFGSIESAPPLPVWSELPMQNAIEL